MSFSDHKITKFTHPVSELPDQPSLPPKDLKARFDSSPEELRQAVNGICDDAARLDDRVSGIVAQTFGDSIEKSMLSSELQSEIEEKASQDALTAETTAREVGDAALTQAIAQKCTCYFGSYRGDGALSRVISLDFTPKAVWILINTGYREGAGGSTAVYGGLALRDAPVVAIQGNEQSTALEICESGFLVYHTRSTPYAFLNWEGKTYHYVVFA